MSLFNNQFPEENDHTGLPVMLFLASAVLLLIPFAGMYLFADTLNPFDLKGKPFLAFYGILSGIVYGTAYVLRIASPERLTAVSGRVVNITVARWIVTATILLGIARLVRGIYLGRPVIFLCLMLLAHAILYQVFFKVAAPALNSTSSAERLPDAEGGER